jgi:membrane protein DedA with SNARE-associated domain
MTAAELVDRGVAALQTSGPAPGLLLAAMAFCEALVVIGIFVPLTPLLVAIGAAIAVGTLHPSILAWAIAGAAVGNLASFVLGRWLNARNLAPPRLPAKAHALAERLFERHGALSIVVARYLGPPATVVPFLAGWSGLGMGRFLAANALASLSWPVAMAMVGYVGAVGWRVALHR